MRRQLALERGDHALGAELLGDDIGADTVLTELRGRRRADGRDLRVAERTRVLPRRREPREERADAVRAREDEPLVVHERTDGRVDGCVAVRRRRDADGGNLAHLGAELLERRREPRGLTARARDEYAPSEERPLAQAVEPLEPVAQLHDVADEEDGGRLEPCRLHILRRAADRRHEHALLRLRAPADDGRGGIGAAAVLDELLRDARQVRDAHEEYERVDARRELVPAHVAPALCRILVSRDDGERGRDGTVRDGDARIGGHGDGGGDARHDLERDALFLEQQALLAAAPEDEGIAALESHDGLALLRLRREQRADVLLAHRVMGGCLADVDALRVRGRPGEDAFIREAVVDDDLRPLEALGALERNQSIISGAGPH